MTLAAVWARGKICFLHERCKSGVASVTPPGSSHRFLTAIFQFFMATALGPNSSFSFLTTANFPSEKSEAAFNATLPRMLAFLRCAFQSDRDMRSQMLPHLCSNAPMAYCWRTVLPILLLPLLMQCLPTLSPILPDLPSTQACALFIPLLVSSCVLAICIRDVAVWATRQVSSLFWRLRSCFCKSLHFSCKPLHAETIVCSFVKTFYWRSSRWL